MASICDQDLPQTPANHAPMSPLSFIERTAEVYPRRLAIVHGNLRQDWATTCRRSRQLASALSQAGIGKNDTVAVILPNTPPMVEAPLWHPHGRCGAQRAQHPAGPGNHRLHAAPRRSQGGDRGP